MNRLNISSGLPRPEHPRPQFWRSEWVNLNGWWEFEVDRGDSGLERGLVVRPLASRILVPFASESDASVWGTPTSFMPSGTGGQ